MPRDSKVAGSRSSISGNDASSYPSSAVPRAKEAAGRPAVVAGALRFLTSCTSVSKGTPARCAISRRVLNSLLLDEAEAAEEVGAAVASLRPL